MTDLTTDADLADLGGQALRYLVHAAFEGGANLSGVLDVALGMMLGHRRVERYIRLLRAVNLFPLDPDCFLIGRACRLCRIWLDRVVVRPLLYQTILHTPQA